MDARTLSLIAVSLAFVGMTGWAFSLNAEVDRLERRLERAKDGRGGKAGKHKRGKGKGSKAKRDREPDAREGRSTRDEKRQAARVEAARELGQRIDAAKTDTGLSEAKRAEIEEAVREEKLVERREAQRQRLAERAAAIEAAARSYAESQGLSDEQEQALMTLIEDSQADASALVQRAEDGTITTGSLRGEMKALRAERDANIESLLGAKDAEPLLSELGAIEPQQGGAGLR